MVDKVNLEKFNLILDQYLDSDEKRKVKEIIYPFFEHPEFQRRMTNEFLHHSDITLGEHILEDTVITFLLCKKKKNVNIPLALKISMMHDLYSLPWQNNIKAKAKHFTNKHGFRHPIEAVINAITWYPDSFSNLHDAEVIIDGMVHHMYPLPVRKYSNDEDNSLELKNYSMLKNIKDEYQEILLRSSNRHIIGNLSFSRSQFIEGRVMSLADKKVSLGQIKNFQSAKALVTGNNKSLKK